MSDLLNTDLTGIFRFFKNSVLTDPAVAPTINSGQYPDFSSLTPLPALTHTGTGIYTGTIFSAAQATQTGDYWAQAYTTDATMDSQLAWCQWEIGPAETAIKAKTDLIGTAGAFTTAPVEPITGATTLTAGASYMNSNGRAGTYTITGYPAFTVNQVCYWRGTTKNGGVRIITGICPTTTTMRFEWTAADTEALESGSFSLYYLTTDSNEIKTPSSSLVIEKST